MKVYFIDSLDLVPFQQNFILFGLGSLGERVARFAKENDLPLVGVADSKRKGVWQGFPIRSQAELHQNKDFQAIVITSQYWCEILENWEGPLDCPIYVHHYEIRDWGNLALNEDQVDLRNQILLTRVAAIFYWGRSGSVFLQTLLDSHPEILNFPTTCLFHFHSQQWETLSKPELTTFTDQANSFISLNQQAFSGDSDLDYQLNQLGPNQDQSIEVNSDAFLEHFHTLAALFSVGEPLTRKLFFLVAHYAYELALGRDISEKNLIIYPLHDPESYQEIHATLMDFPTLIPLGMLRHPFRTFSSHLRHWLYRTRRDELNSQADVQHLVANEALLRCFRHLFIGWRTIQNVFFIPFKVVRLEDLHDDPHSEMRGLAKHLEISWNECLLESTINGLTYWGDRASKEKLKGFSIHKNKSNEWKSYLGLVDRIMIRCLVGKNDWYDSYCLKSWFSSVIGPFLFFIPMRLEVKALWKFRSDSDTLKKVFLNYLERVLSSYKILLGFPEMSAQGAGRPQKWLSREILLNSRFKPKSARKD